MKYGLRVGEDMTLTPHTLKESIKIQGNSVIGIAFETKLATG